MAVPVYAFVCVSSNRLTLWKTSDIDCNWTFRHYASVCAHEVCECEKKNKWKFCKLISPVLTSASEKKIEGVIEKMLKIHRYRVLNALSHSLNVHAYGFTLVCTRTCIFKLYDVRNALRHPSSAHLNLYSPEIYKFLFLHLNSSVSYIHLYARQNERDRGWRWDQHSFFYEYTILIERKLNFNSSYRMFRIEFYGHQLCKKKKRRKKTTAHVRISTHLLNYSSSL